MIHYQFTGVTGIFIIKQRKLHVVSACIQEILIRLLHQHHQWVHHLFMGILHSIHRIFNQRILIWITLKVWFFACADYGAFAHKCLKRAKGSNYNLLIYYLLLTSINSFLGKICCLEAFFRGESRELQLKFRLSKMKTIHGCWLTESRVGSENSSNLEPFAEVEQVKLNKILGFPQQPKSNW